MATPAPKKKKSPSLLDKLGLAEKKAGKSGLMKHKGLIKDALDAYPDPKKKSK